MVVIEGLLIAPTTLGWARDKKIQGMYIQRLFLTPNTFGPRLITSSPNILIALFTK